MDLILDKIKEEIKNILIKNQILNKKEEIMSIYYQYK